MTQIPEEISPIKIVNEYLAFKKIIGTSKATLEALEDFALYVVCKHIPVSLHPSTEWVSVEDRLPERKREGIPISDTVLVYSESYDLITAYYHYGIEMKLTPQWRSEETGEKIEDVTHWQYLPAPPSKP